MKPLLSILFLLLPFLPAWAQECFQPIQDGKPVTTICVGKPVFFRDCNAASDPNAVIFYYPGPGKFDPKNFEQDDLLTGEEAVTFTQPGTYIITQIINTGNDDEETTKILEQTFEVKASPAPTFSFVRCAGGKVSFTITDNQYDTYSLDFGDGQGADVTAGQVIEHDYGTSGSFTATLTGRFAEGQCSNTSSQVVEPLPIITADNQILIDKLTVLEQGANGSLQLELSGLVPGYTYVVERYVDGVFNPYEEVGRIQNVASSTLTHTASNVNTSVGTWFLVRPVDDCGGASLNSTIVSSILLKATTNEEEVTLDWSYLPEFAAFEVYRNGTLLETLPGTTERFVDEEVTCGQTYNYYVVGTGTTYQGANYASVSAPIAVQVTSSATPAAPYLLASFNLNNQVELTLQDASGITIQTATFERSINGGAYSQLAQVPLATFTDSEGQPQPACYRATLTSACGNTSPVSNVACPILLEAAKQVDGSVNLSWTPYTGFQGGVGRYTVELLDESGNVAASYPANGTTYTDRSLNSDLPELRYRFKAIAKNGTGVTYSNVEVMEQEADVFIPSAFTPNGDGLNDVFEVKGKFFSGYTLRVYDRRGNVVYEGTETDTPWNGTHNGKELLPGAYAYILTLRTSFGASKQKTGTITLLR